MNIKLESRDYIGIIIVCTIIYLLYENLCNKNSIEKMANTDDTKIREEINIIYKADIQAIRNLADVSKKLQEKGLRVPGDLTIEGKFNYLPTGSIIAFKGTTAPKGWVVCDGRNGTPNLKGRFIYGYNATNRIGSVGGAATVRLTAAQMPSHTHYISSAGSHHHNFGTRNDDFNFRGCPGGPSFGQGDCGFKSWNTNSTGAHRHNMNATGGNQAHNNMPPYCVLLYIMKL